MTPGRNKSPKGSQISNDASRAGFGFWGLRVRPSTGELRRDGIKVPLQEQPLRLLTLLLEHTGKVLSREEIETQLWPDDAYGDLDHRLNNAINKIRIALGDSADHPRFLETIKRRGYRFAAPVHEVGSAVSGGSSTRPPQRSQVLKGAAAAVIGASARSWGVDYILEGSVRQESDQLRITIQLVRGGPADPAITGCSRMCLAYSGM